MVETRKATGHSAPRKADPLMEAGPTSKQRVTKPTPKSTSTGKRGRPAGSKVAKAATDVKNKTKAAAGKVKKEAVKAEKKVEKKATETKANTGKPRAKKAEGRKEKVVSGRVEKKPAAKKVKTPNKREPGIMDKIEGAVEKVVGTIQGKPGKKVCLSIALQGLGCLDKFSLRSGSCYLDFLMLTDMWIGCRHTKDAWNGRQGRQARRKSLVVGGPRYSDIPLHRF